jgi:drug/metabolite transporter (DMT)-like permease
VVWCIQAMDLSEASVIIFTAPLWTAILSVVTEKKGSWTRSDTAAAVCCIFGMVLIMKPPAIFGGEATSPETGLGVMSALISAISMAGVNISIRKVKEEDTSTITLYAMVGCVILATPGFMWEQVAGVGKEVHDSTAAAVLQLSLTGLLSWGAQMSKTRALQMSKFLGVLVMRYLDILFAFMWNVTLLHAKYDALMGCGVALLIGGCLISILAKGG